MADVPVRLPSASPPAPSGNGYHYGANYPARDPLAPHGVSEHRSPRPRPRGWTRRRMREHPHTGTHQCPDGTRVHATAQYLPALPGADPDNPGIAGSSNGVTVYRFYRGHPSTRPRGEFLGWSERIGDTREQTPDWTVIDHHHQKGDAA